MRPVLGIAIGGDAVRAVLVADGEIKWAGAAPYATVAEVADVIGRLAGEGNGVARPRRVRVVLERAVVQLRTVVPAPPLKLAVARRWVDLEAPRLFRKNGTPLVTDAVIMVLSAGRALWAVAATEPLLENVLAGCAAAGLVPETVGAAAEVLPHALDVVPRSGTLLFPNGGPSEALDIEGAGAWRSRLVRATSDAPEISWRAPLAKLGMEAAHFAAAFGAAVTTPRFQLFPAAVRRARERDRRRSLLTLVAVGALAWFVAAAVYVARLSVSVQSSTQSLHASRPAVDSVLGMRRDLGLARVALATVAHSAADRSRHLSLLAEIARALPDSVYLVSWQVSAERAVRLTGYAPVAARALAAIERVPLLAQARFEGPVMREAVPNVGERDRFSVVARLEARP